MTERPQWITDRMPTMDDLPFMFDGGGSWRKSLPPGWFIAEMERVATRWCHLPLDNPAPKEPTEEHSGDPYNCPFTASRPHHFCPDCYQEPTMPEPTEPEPTVCSWQPIETVPLDEWVLLAWGDGSVRTMIRTKAQTTATTSATHWAPLPKAPGPVPCPTCGAVQ